MCMPNIDAVSYTHLDVYKRQHQFRKAGAFLLTGIGREQRGAEDTLADRVRLPVVAEGVRDV